MTIDSILILAQDIILAITGIFIGWQVYLLQTQTSQAKKEKILRIVDSVFTQVKSTQQGVYIPGMSEKAGEQLKNKLRNLLEEEL